VNRPLQRRAPLAALLVAALACGPAEGPSGPDAADRLVGSWRAVLLSPGGDLPFGLEIERRDGGLAAVAINASERAPFSHVELDGDDVTLAFDGYDSRIEARFDGDDRMTGRWWKTVPSGISTLDFVATRGAGDRFEPLDTAARPGAFADVGGTWRAELVDDEGTEPAQGELRQEGTRVTGTFLTPTGDYRFLDGTFESGLLRLSTFDGGHAFLFHARAQADGTLAGSFWSRDTYHARWTASRAAAGEPILPDAWSLAGLTSGDGRFRFDFKDLDGRSLASEDPRFTGKVVLVNVFGSWCPNCNDEAPLLAEWDRRYRRRGLEIVGLAYEYSGEPERDRRYVRKYAKRHGIEFPLLLAGISDKAAAAETLPDLSAVIAFPTSIFIGRDGKVRRIHSGFSGPGTGAHHYALVAELEAAIESLLAEAPPA
jgi:thiol-disulfide isomerase/thioredoxin